MSIAAAIFLVGMSTHVLAMSYDYRYLAGYQFGEREGKNACISGDPYNPSTCQKYEHHSWQYCQGFTDGYNDYWHRF